MKVLKAVLVPNESIPEFKRLRFEVVERPLREVLLNGLHPLGLASGFGGHRDGSGLAEAVAERLNGEENVLAGLKDVGHSFGVKPPARQYRYGYESRQSDKDDALEALEHVGNDLYFVERLGYPELVEVARRRLARNWSHAIARELLTKKFWAFNDQRRFLKARSGKVKLRSREQMDDYDLGEILSIEDFRDADKLLVEHGIPGVVNFRNCKAVRNFTTADGLVSLVPRISHFEMRIYENVNGHPMRFGGHVRYTCQLQDGRIRLLPEMKLTDDKDCRERARAIAAELAHGGRYCFMLEIEKLEALLGRAEIRFPNLTYSKTNGGQADLPRATFRTDVGAGTFVVGPVATDHLTNGMLAKLLREYGKKVSGTKDELAERLTELLVRLYKKSEKVLDRYFKQGFVRLNGAGGGPRPDVFEPPIKDGGLRHSIVALYVLKHLRGSRILSSDWENTAYSVEDLAKALVERRVSVDGVFVKSVRG